MASLVIPNASAAPASAAASLQPAAFIAPRLPSLSCTARFRWGFAGISPPSPWRSPHPWHRWLPWWWFQ